MNGLAGKNGTAESKRHVSSEQSRVGELLQTPAHQLPNDPSNLYGYPKRKQGCTWGALNGRKKSEESGEKKIQ